MAKGDPRMDDERAADATDVCLWVDTDVMLADPLTKKMEATKLWEALDSNFWDMKQPIESLRKKRMKQEQRRKTERFTDEEKQAMKDEWTAYTRYVLTNKYMTSFGKGGPSWDDVVWREIVDADTGIVLEDKPKEIITKRDLHKVLERRMTLKITLYTDTKPKLPEHRNSEPGDFPETGDYPEDHGSGPGNS